MSNANLPERNVTVRDERLPTFFRGNRAAQLLLAGAIVAVGAGGAFFVLSHFTLVAGLLATLGVGLFVTRQLVHKSLSLTAPAAGVSAGVSLAGSSAGSTVSVVAERLESVRKQVSKCKFLEHVEAEGSLAAEQAVQLVQQHKQLHMLLTQKFEPGEITFSRYSEAINASCLAIAENLLVAESALQNLNASQVNSSGELWKKQFSDAQNLLATVRSALDELVRLHTSLNEITTKDIHRDQLEHNLEQVRLLAERAKQYSRK